jgi:hypothetical protein
MPSHGLVKLKTIEEMLDACAPGAVIEHRKHHTWVTAKGKTYRRLPRGEHGARSNPEIQTGHIKKMARFFDILDCAKNEIEALR